LIDFVECYYISIENKKSELLQLSIKLA